MASDRSILKGVNEAAHLLEDDDGDKEDQQAQAG